MPSVYACGDNSFGNLQHASHDHLLSPVQFAEGSTVLAACWSQTIIESKDGSRQLLGLESSSLDLSARQWLGQDSFVAWLRRDGRIESLDGSTSTSSFSHAVMNGRGELLGVSADETNSVTFYSSLGSLLLPSTASPPLILSSPLLTPSSQIVSLIAGAGHFLILLAAPSHAILAYGDNRFAQLGLPPSSRGAPTQLRHLDYFEGLAPRTVAAGAFHTAVVSGDGALYVFGKGTEGQCGDEGGGEPTSVQLGDGQEEVQSVDCGSGHTVAITDRGVWVTGSNTAGQLAFGDMAARFAFTRSDVLSSLVGAKSARVTCTRWGTWLNVDDA